MGPPVADGGVLRSRGDGGTACSTAVDGDGVRKAGWMLGSGGACLWTEASAGGPVEDGGGDGHGAYPAYGSLTSRVSASSAMRRMSGS